jgi:hypothetical protein
MNILANQMSTHRAGLGPAVRGAAAEDLVGAEHRCDLALVRVDLPESEKGVRLAQKMQVGPCIPVGRQL